MTVMHPQAFATTQDFAAGEVGYPQVSPFAHLLDELALYGARPGEDEVDHRPMPEVEDAQNAISDAIDVLAGVFSDTRLEDDTENLLWGFVNLFHHQINRVERDLDRNEQDQRQLQRAQDGSEVKAVELERRTAEGITLQERRNAFEFFREAAAEHFQARVGTVWRPSRGSRVGGRHFTSAYIDSRDFLAAERQRKSERLVPEGDRIAFTAGQDYQDHRRIWDVLDKVHAKHPKMILLHTASKSGGDLIASKWCDARGVPQVAFEPKWHLKKAAPFKRNDELLEALPIGLVTFPGNGIQDNLADKAKKLGIQVADYRNKR